MFDLVLSLAKEGQMVYTDSKLLYIDFMLDRISRDFLLEQISNLSSSEQKKLFSMNKMGIFQNLYENMATVGSVA
jgi:hypothetical protein